MVDEVNQIEAAIVIFTYWFQYFFQVKYSPIGLTHTVQLFFSKKNFLNNEKYNLPKNIIKCKRIEFKLQNFKIFRIR
jgi:hypothetical protein